MADAPPGWYPDPDMAGTRRYWDGAKWSDHVAPAEDRERPGGLRLVGIIAAGILVAVGLLWFGYVFVHSSDQTKCQTAKMNAAYDDSAPTPTCDSGP